MTDSAPDQALADLTAAKQHWAWLSIADKVGYLERFRPLVRDAAAEWVAAALDAKAIPAGSPLAGEEWISGPYAVLSWMAAATETLDAVACGDNPLKGFPIRQRPDGQTIVCVYPHDLKERLLLHGFSTEVWMQPGTTVATLPGEVARRVRRHGGQGKVALVLGAGNIASIPLLDVLYKLYADGEVVVLKMNLVNAYLGPIFEKALAPLVADGYLRYPARRARLDRGSAAADSGPQWSPTLRGRAAPALAPRRRARPWPRSAGTSVESPRSDA